jgi:hypothetical protein
MVMLNGGLIPADSKRFNTALAIPSFSWSKRWAWQKLGSVRPCGCGAPLHGKDWAPHHPCREQREICSAKVRHQQGGGFKEI